MRPLALSERMAVLAAAISIDFDFFSQHSSGAGGGFMPFLFPMPFPSYPPPEDGGAAGAGAEGSEGAAAGDAGTLCMACPCLQVHFTVLFFSLQVLRSVLWWLTKVCATVAE